MLEDLLNYDPRNEAFIGRNTLTSPPRHDLNSYAVPVTPEDSCHHVFVQKLISTDSTPPLDSRPDSSTVYELHAICQRCVHHLDLRIDYRGNFRSRADSGASVSGSNFFPCPNADSPLHHFQFITEHAVPRTYGAGSNASSGERVNDRTFYFKCSADSCLAKLMLTLRAPVFPEEYVDMLSDTALLEQRLQQAIASDPERLDFKAARPVDAFEALITYLRDSINQGHQKRRIPVKNRRFMVTFGEDCPPLLESLGFKFVDEDGDGDGFCYLPDPSEHSDPEAVAAYLAEVRDELSLHLDAQPYTEKASLKNPPLIRRPILTDLRRCLGFADYDKIPSSRRNKIDLTGETDTFYAGLGALPDFSDKLIAFAFDQQVKCDPDNRMYYFDCLVEIQANRRNSEELELKIVMLKSQGFTSKADIADAYRYFGIDFNSYVDEQYVAGNYTSRLSAVPPAQHAECREQLRLIAGHIGSRSLMDLASNEMETVDQAYSYLGGDASIQDDFITSMYTSKIADDPSTKEMARKALRIIADTRKSAYLKSVLDNADGIHPTMDIAEACSILQIDNRAEISPDVLPVLVQARILEAPEREDEFNRAYAVVASQFDGNSGQLNGLNAQQSSRRPEEWPVGIDNLGATCYLNSLLQFYFTIKPLRDLLLSFDEHKIEVTPQIINSRKVGGRRVSAKETLRSSDCKCHDVVLLQLLLTSP